MPVSPQPPPLSAFMAHTTVLIVLCTATGIVNERFVAGMGLDQVLHARALGAVSDGRAAPETRPTPDVTTPSWPP